MNIFIEDLPKKLRPDVRRVGGNIDPDEVHEECFTAKFDKHKLQTLGDYVLIIDNATNEKLILYKGDFYNIEIS